MINKYKYIAFWPKNNCVTLKQLSAWFDLLYWLGSLSEQIESDHWPRNGKVAWLLIGNQSINHSINRSIDLSINQLSMNLRAAGETVKRIADQWSRETAAANGAEQRRKWRYTLQLYRHHTEIEQRAHVSRDNDAFGHTCIALVTFGYDRLFGRNVGH